MQRCQTQPITYVDVELIATAPSICAACPASPWTLGSQMTDRRPKIISAAFSTIINIGALVFPEGMSEFQTPREFLRSLKNTRKYSNCVLIKVLTGLMLNHTFP